jgi:hypothetical protein
MRPYATSAWGLKLLVSRPSLSSTSAWGLKLLVHEALSHVLLFRLLGPPSHAHGCQRLHLTYIIYNTCIYIELLKHYIEAHMSIWELPPVEDVVLIAYGHYIEAHMSILEILEAHMSIWEIAPVEDVVLIAYGHYIEAHVYIRDIRSSYVYMRDCTCRRRRSHCIWARYRETGARWSSHTCSLCARPPATLLT